MEESSKKRGTLLTAWLVLLLIGRIIGIVTMIYFYLLNGESIQLYSGTILSRTSILPIWGTIIHATVLILSIFFIILLFMWKKIGFFGILTVDIMYFLLNVVVSRGVTFTSMFTLIGPIILYSMLKPKWELLE